MVRHWIRDWQCETCIHWYAVDQTHRVDYDSWESFGAHPPTMTWVVNVDFGWLACQWWHVTGGTLDTYW